MLAAQVDRVGFVFGELCHGKSSLHAGTSSTLTTRSAKEKKRHSSKARCGLSRYDIY